MKQLDVLFVSHPNLFNNKRSKIHGGFPLVFSVGNEV